MKKFTWNILVLFFLPVFFIAAIIPFRRRLFIWGSTPLLSYKYWSEAINEAGYPSVTLMEGYFSINKRSDYDMYFEDFAPKFLHRVIRMGLGTCFAFIYVLKHAKVIHIPFLGFALGNTWAWRLESPLFRLAGIKVITTSFGADAYMYSKIMDTSLRYGLLASYPKLALKEKKITADVAYWTKNSDAIITGLMLDGIGRWDVTLNQFFSINTNEWVPKTFYSDADGFNGIVRILHTPNHRGFKGTEFLVDAVQKLKNEGLQIDLVLLEGVSNEMVKQAMQEVDILAEQFIATGYALSGIEGMASGLPVLANLEHEAYTRVYRRYGFLNECPIVSSSPETLQKNIRILVTNPQLREDLGKASRSFAEKYHSYKTARYIFGSIYDKILFNKEVDLINLFHPLKSDYYKSMPLVEHPLIENRIPARYFVNA